ncbi:hypothetical protein GCM10010109_86300 [Actinoplanes campanulatus]|nr:hypothetical protein GCM10010109_86300 [Actinoplanes campanulatus]GID41756.1 hypothetical protein Aca09nite_82620 [Actinoplanes campanulatus]
MGREEAVEGRLRRYYQLSEAVRRPYEARSSGSGAGPKRPKISCADEVLSPACRVRQLAGGAA